MKKLALVFIALVFISGICPGAASEFWEAKPFSDWTDREVRLMMSNSPWAHEILLTETAVGYAPVTGGSTGGRHGGGSFSSAGASGISTTPSTTRLVVLWESALPARQAMARFKFGAEAATSREAKELLEQEEANYVIVLTGLPASFVKGDVDKIKEELQARTTLTVKGRKPFKPERIEVLADGKTVGAYFEFTRTNAITTGDKDVEFSTKIGEKTARHEFHLQEMVINGKLEL